MGATGQTVSDVQTEAVGIRCPIGDCKTILADPYVASDVVAGHIYAVSNMLVVALQDRADDATNVNVPCAYEIPMLAIGPQFEIQAKVAQAWAAGERLSYKLTSDLIVAYKSAFSVIGYVLEAKIANASECLIHFKGDAEADLAMASS
jgi:hypothetical protein